MFCFRPPKNVMKAYFLAYQDVTFKSAVKMQKIMTHWIFSNFLWQGEKQSGAKSDHHHQAIYQDDSFPWLRFQNRSPIQKKWFSNFDRNWFFEIWNFFSKPFTYLHVHAKMAWLGFFSVFIWDALENYFIRSVSNSLPPPNV